jgi:nucleotide-binding universal stress UspA family protein
MATIVCGVDGSPGAGEAVRVASGLSEALGARLVLAHVAARREGLRGTQVQDGATRLLERVAQEHGLNGDVDRRTEMGHRATGLAGIAAEEAATLIVVGSGSERRRRRSLRLGLTAELNGTASCPVLVVPPAPRR